ncbi:hypothetical protein C489_21131 [Natrinema versiforme JCM 10478]|uniref:Uncharacterized protein n=1 Tax=Natrinema versiforme JCM 10478 TaxID=1227496 RepID=L9XN33_9EURY|nr:hypothetical protein C489_21131 [Natrinema versiforme JCM 10478]
MSDDLATGLSTLWAVGRNCDDPRTDGGHRSPCGCRAPPEILLVNPDAATRTISRPTALASDMTDDGN